MCSVIFFTPTETDWILWRSDVRSGMPQIQFHRRHDYYRRHLCQTQPSPPPLPHPTTCGSENCYITSLWFCHRFTSFKTNTPNLFSCYFSPYVNIQVTRQANTVACVHFPITYLVLISLKIIILFVGLFLIFLDPFWKV